MIFTTRMEVRRVPCASKLENNGVNNCYFFRAHACRGLIISILWVLFYVFAASAENTYPVAWNWPSNATAAVVQAQYPWIKLSSERVNISISLDAGATYEPLATGVDSVYGDNTWYFNLPDSTHYLSASAFVRVSSMPQYRQADCVVTVPVVIAGIRFINPPSVVTNGSSVTLRWVSAGAGNLVQLGTRPIGGDEWRAQAVCASVDSTQGGTTNSVTWSVSGLDAVPTEILLQSIDDPLCYRRAALEVLP